VKADRSARSLHEFGLNEDVFTAPAACV
jgi:hypothetical protein